MFFRDQKKDRKEYLKTLPVHLEVKKSQKQIKALNVPACVDNKSCIRPCGLICRRSPALEGEPDPSIWYFLPLKAEIKLILDCP